MPTLADLASDYYNRQFNQDNLTNLFGSLFADGSVSPAELNSVLLHPSKFTGSGRQGSGLWDLNNAYFTKDGDIFLNSGLGSQQLNTTGMDGGVRFWEPTDTSEMPVDDQGRFFRDTDSGREYINKNQLEGKFRWDDLSGDVRNRIINEGLFPNINKQFSDLGITSSFTPDSIGSGISSKLQPYLSNIGKPESEGFLLQPRNIGTLLSLVAGGIGVLPASAGLSGAAGFLNTAASVANLGNSLSNGNLGSSILNGISMYNNAAGLANSALNSNEYARFNPSEYVSRNLGIENPTVGRYVGNAIVNGGRAALDGDDIGRAVRNSVMNTAVGDLGEQFGLPDMAINLIQMGLPALFSSGSTNTQPRQTTTTPNQTTPIPGIPPIQQPNPYTISNPISMPSYTNPFGNIPSPYTPSYGQPMLAEYDDSVDDLSDTNNPYNTAVNYSGSGRNIYG